MLIQSDAARLLFEKINSVYLRGLVGNEFETNILECKEKAAPASLDLDASDVSNFAKALSGFANTSGGIILWGVKARKVSEIDQIQEIVPISDLKRFEAKLRERESTLVEYVVPDVQYKPIPLAGESGVLAMFVPQSPLLPHRVNHKNDHHFYIRAGGVFSPLPLSIVEDLFSRRTSPILELFLKQTQGGSPRKICVCLRNRGKVTARFPFVVLKLPDYLSPTGWELDENTRLTSWISTRTYHGQSGKFVTWNDGNKFVIHPGQELEILNLSTLGTQISGNMEFSIEYFLYADAMASKSGIESVKTV